MSDLDEAVTRKLSGGKKIVEKVATATETVAPAEKKRKLVDGNIMTMFGGSKPAPKSVEEPSTSSEPPPPAEQAILDLEQTMGRDWYEALKDEFTKPYFRSIRNFLIAETRKKATIYPKTEDIYNWSRLTPLEDVRVIILGQDPYHGPNQAHGLAFSVLPPTRPPPSLVNIYKELKNSIPGFVIPKSGDLTPLAQAGVLWLNTSLTVRASEAGSHSKIGWDKFTRAVMEAVLARPSKRGVVFMAWGAHAQKAIAGFDQKKNKILKSVHPSPLSANKGFLGCNHFKLANEWLEEKYGEEAKVDWTAINPK
ncbi:Uracil-DNA glycosylase {ECO:0000255/HAMAP-Rule:MF_00148} Short=UDG {ECO:0000255/HAMAP-Rule:MF_00148}; {ECO:0000255/HAMAP-Rule:MF_00148} [Serendipita indica DSM 11827]|uniref:Uracil-DNA glycosylase n=1 Tax=Serendipita indica (strain DSM 11827) TaxID=1109443 RepID=G4T6H9_SERID|nr:Uracil-DNA glycosylase {ECO:0000255/HAMAP-Rule:MF_00148} Short=UDG {ECO:0000255/HAMAP-Rule:MF_00148}; {ECO:0000255/HAMAP-Rule:MF_00148} [Serendipita indica DSM 11827]CCA66898.1 probable uracil-DNA glycosylase [Serendipita indica DSM 11827]